MHAPRTIAPAVARIPAGVRALARASAPAALRGPRAALRAAEALALFLLAGLAGCGGSGGASDGRAPLQAGAAAPEPLRLRLEVPESAFAGQPVPLRLVLENAGDRPVEVGLVGRPVAFDLVVATADGDPIWRRLEGVAVPDVLRQVTLAPREEMGLAHEWDQRGRGGRRVSPGTYQVRGALPVADAPEGWTTEPQLLTILP